MSTTGMSPRTAAMLTLWLGCLAAPVLAAEPVVQTDCLVVDPALQGHFQGQCVAGMAEGKGRAWQDGGAYYEGDFVAGRRSGQGVLVYANGDSYAGGWLADMRDGVGRYAYGEQSPWRGDVYFGQWRADMRHGQGTYVFWPSGERYASEWVDNVPLAPPGPTMSRRKQAMAVLAPVIGQVGAQVCSIATEGAGPDRMARGQVQAVIDDRIQVAIDTPAVQAASAKPALATRWEILTDWMPCPKP